MVVVVVRSAQVCCSRGSYCVGTEKGGRETEMLKDRSFSPRRKGRKGKGKKEGRIHHCNSETVLTGRRHRLTWLTA